MERLRVRGIFNQDCVADYSQPCPRNHALKDKLCLAREGHVKTCSHHIRTPSCYCLLRALSGYALASAGNGPPCARYVQQLDCLWRGSYLYGFCMQRLGIPYLAGLPLPPGLFAHARLEVCWCLGVLHVPIVKFKAHGNFTAACDPCRVVILCSGVSTCLPGPLPNTFPVRSAAFSLREGIQNVHHFCVLMKVKLMYGPHRRRFAQYGQGSFKHPPWRCAE